jgi:hypothetical protein
MAEPQNDGQTPERYETTDPKNPPYSVTNKAVRSAALVSYLGPLVALFIVVGLALVYWANRGPVYDGVEDGRIGTTGSAGTPGGFDPAPRPDSTRDELESRGVNTDHTLTNLHQMVGQRIDVADATVTDAQGPTMFWIEKDGAKAAVSAPQGGPAVRNGQDVTVSGVVESDGQGGARIRATRVSVD